MYEHQPDFATVVIAARPDNDQADAEPVVLSASCVCGLSTSWEASVYAARSTGWSQSARHLKWTLEDQPRTMGVKK